MQGESMHDDAQRHDDAKKKITKNSNIGDFPGRYSREELLDPPDLRVDGGGGSRCVLEN
jgi:hypothetical protein